MSPETIHIFLSIGVFFGIWFALSAGVLAISWLYAITCSNEKQSKKIEEIEQKLLESEIERKDVGALRERLKKLEKDKANMGGAAFLFYVTLMITSFMFSFVL